MSLLWRNFENFNFFMQLPSTAMKNEESEIRNWRIEIGIRKKKIMLIKILKIVPISFAVRMMNINRKYY